MPIPEKWVSRLCVILPLSFMFSGCLSVKVTPPKTAEATNAAPLTHTVTRSASKPKAQLDGVFEATEMVAVKVEPKAWTDLTVVQAVTHGTRVNRGEVLVKLDADKLKEQIEEMELDKPAGVLGLELAVAELENLQQNTPAKLEAARRAHRLVTEDFAYFEKTGRPQREKSAHFNVKNAEQRLDGAQEELKQLSKMYKDDDLVEDTEEIILKRQKFAVESAEFSLESTKLGTEFSLKTGIPRESENLRAGKRDQDLALVYAEETIPRTLAKKRYDVEKLKRDQKKTEKKLADLKKDLENMEVRAPMDGWVYYGACEGGKWTTGAAVAKKLVPSGKLTPNEVFMTVVNAEKLIARAVVQEADLGQFKAGMSGKASPVCAAEKKLEVKLEEIGAIPLPSGGYEAKLSVQLDSAVPVVPGMNCKVSLRDSGNSELLAPKQAVFTEPEGACVYVVKANAKFEKRAVKTGKSEEKMVEILQGLSEGEQIYLSKPQ